MKYECFENDCYNLYTIKTNKFNSCHLEVIFRNRCTKENVTYLALLFDMLMENSKDYPTRKELVRKEQDLYNTSIYSVNSRVGGLELTNVVANFLDPKFMDENSLEEIIKLVFSLIFNPNVEVDEFDEDTFNRVKTRLSKEIDRLKEDPKQSSILSALGEIDKTSPRCFNSSGDADILKDITPKKLYKFYKNVLENSLVDIYIVGNLDMKSVNKLIKKYALFTSIKTEKVNLYLDEISSKKTMSASRQNSLTQLNVVQVYSLKGLDSWEINYVMPIFNLLWGSGSLESKLYKTVREENSLCYNISTFYQKYDRNIILHTAIDKENYNKALKLIKGCMQDMCKGNISEEELSNIKEMVINSLNLIYDSPNRLVDNYLFSNLASLPDIEKRIDEFNKVTIKDLIAVSKKINLVLNYKEGE